MYRKYQAESREASKESTNVTVDSFKKTDDWFKAAYDRSDNIHLKVDWSELFGVEETTTSNILDKEVMAGSKEEAFERLHAIATKVADRKYVVKRKDAIEDVRFIYNLYDLFNKKMSQTELQNFRKEVTMLIIESGILKYLTKIIVTYPADVYRSIASYEDIYLLNMTLSLLLVYMDDSDELTEAVAGTAITKFCKNLLDKCVGDHIGERLPENLEKTLHAIISLLYRLSLCEANVKELRQLEFTESLQPYLKSPNEDVGFIAMSVLANIVTEAECEVIEANTHLVAKLLYFLQKGAEKQSHVHEGWSTKKCSRAVRNLAKHDAHKKLLWKLNALETLADVAHTGNEDDQLESVHGIWSLCFDEDVRNDVLSEKDSRIINLLEQLKQSGGNEDIKDACNKCLWTLHQKGKTTSETAGQESVTSTTQDQKKDTSGHIMISYQSHDRPVLLKIKRILEEKNYKVWMDVDQMGGSTLEAMAEAVENSIVVLLCYSRKYKESVNTRLEAEYVHEQRKPFIPLKMELGYKPDGWLGLLIGSRYFVEFSGKYKFEDKMVDLFRELDRILKPPSEEKNTTLYNTGAVQQALPRSSIVNNTAISQVNEKDVNRSSDQRNNTDESKGRKLEQIKHIRKWSRNDVLNWLSENGLENQSLDELTGEEIAFLARVMVEAPNKIYDFLNKDLKVDTLLTKSRLVWALDELSNKRS